ncbi:MAG: transcription-repair coupling factor [Oscillospiraceae bacterium]|nr:transcription-repair coupling factor [Oscillospiraceae bacterium]
MEPILNAILNIPSLSTLQRQIEEGILPAVVSGTSPALRSLLACALRSALRRPLLVVCADEAAAEQLRLDLRASGEEVCLLPDRDLTLRNADTVSRQQEQERLRLLDRLVRGEAQIVLATVGALQLRTLPPEVLREEAFTVDMSGPGPEELEQRLLRCGYTRCEMVEGSGQYARRGAILDIFSPGETRPLRIEYWGDEPDSMGFFDIDTQRRSESAESFRVLPAGEVQPGMHPAGSSGFAAALERSAGRMARKKTGDEPSRVLRADAERAGQGISLPWCDRYLPLVFEEYATVLDYLPEDTLVFIDSPGRCQARAEENLSRLSEDCKQLTGAGIPVMTANDYLLPWPELCRQLRPFGVVQADAFTAGRYTLNPRSLFNAEARQLPGYGGSAETALEDVKRYLEQQYSVVLLCGDSRRAEVMALMLEEAGIHALRGFTAEGLPPPGCCSVAVGSVSSGIELPESRVAVLTDAQIAPERTQRKKKRRAMADRERLGSCADLTVGDLVVHEHHGIGRFAGIFKIPVDGVQKDYIKIKYAGSDALYVPATQLDLVSKYIGAADADTVKLNKMSGGEWQRTRSRTKAAVKELAAQLLKLYAAREKAKGHAFSPDTPWQKEFEDAFGYTETDDQLRAIGEIKHDMEAPTPMDRLLCGDVGYGKTEVALRAVMKCIMDNKQACLLCPTTVLARQHYQTAAQRFFGYPVHIDVLSRFRTGNQMKKALEDVRSGRTDLLIGTHRLLSKDVRFKDLGLVVVDEEQRFGVAHKEKLKELTKGVDVLTLSATPIPRTLNMALSGIRQLSGLEEPPQGRQAVRTYVMEHDWPTLCDAMRRELQRGGQVYYLHNRVENIEHTAARIAALLEGASVGVAHGKMSEEQLSSVMDDMIEGRIQILVCTTIIETGIDIPNVNTLIIEDADRLGLAQLHQLRGRVGRSSRRASAYLTYRKDKIITEVAEKRLSAIREFAEFNAGFQIAMRDLEIRGAGNLLGAEQSGHLIDVGYDLYLKLLNEAVAEEKGETVEKRAECSADLTVSANIPELYVPSAEQRMDIYRRIALIRDQADADDMVDELIDRFGEPPQSVLTLVRVALLRGEAAPAGITDISQKGGVLRFIIPDFSMERVSALYARPEMKNRLKVDAGRVPALNVKIAPNQSVLDCADEFVKAWRESGSTLP